MVSRLQAERGTGRGACSGGLGDAGLELDYFDELANACGAGVFPYRHSAVAEAAEER